MKKQMKKLLQLLLGTPAMLATVALFAAAEAKAAPQWTNGTAVNCSAFTPSENNLLRNKLVSFTMTGNEIAEHHRLYSHVVTWSGYTPGPKASDGKINLAKYSESIWLKDKSALTDGDASFAGSVTVPAADYPQPAGFNTPQSSVLLYNSPAYPVRDNAVATFSFPGRATVRSLKVYAWWADNGRNQPQIASVEVLVDGVWTAVANSALTGSAVSDAKKLPNATLADSDLGYLAKGVSAIRINFGAQQANEAGYAEIEAIGEWESELALEKSIPGHPDWGYTLDYVRDGMNYTAYVYTNTTATMSWTVPAGVTKIDYLVVGGGGGGGGTGYFGGGGGGAGGVLQNSYSVSGGATLTVTVGDGGSGGAGTSEYADAAQGSNGDPSTLKNGTATIASAAGGGGGGGACKSSTTKNGLVGGSGGGGAVSSGTGGSGTTGQGYAGGKATLVGDHGVGSAGAGGGGAGGAGGAGVSSGSVGKGGAGGVGIWSAITGASRVYAAGGTGGAWTDAGSETSTFIGLAANGAPNSGSGGGGANHNSDSDASEKSGGAGGSGVVVIRYATTPCEPIPDGNNWGYVINYCTAGGLNYTAYVYTNTAATTMTFTVPAGVNSLDYLVVGGGGAGGFRANTANAGGGGGGGVLSDTALTVNGGQTFNLYSSVEVA